MHILYIFLYICIVPDNIANLKCVQCDHLADGGGGKVQGTLVIPVGGAQAYIGILGYKGIIKACNTDGG